MRFAVEMTSGAPRYVEAGYWTIFSGALQFWPAGNDPAAVPLITFGPTAWVSVQEPQDDGQAQAA